MLKCDCSADGECNLLRLIEKWLLTVFFMKVVGVEN